MLIVPQGPKRAIAPDTVILSHGKAVIRVVLVVPLHPDNDAAQHLYLPRLHHARDGVQFEFEDIERLALVLGIVGVLEYFAMQEHVESFDAPMLVARNRTGQDFLLVGIVLG